MSKPSPTVRRDPPGAFQDLCTMFPQFERWWNDEEVENRLVDGVHSDLTHHRLLVEFLDFFAQEHRSFAEPQLQSLGAWVNEAISIQDDLGHAVSSGFLGHSRELHVQRVLAPYLSQQAKTKLRT